jgi:hypothetical protein
MGLVEFGTAPAQLNVVQLNGLTSFHRNRSIHMGTGTLILLIILVILLLGAAPTWPHSRSWGYAPSGGIGLVIVILLLLYFFGMLNF